MNIGYACITLGLIEQSYKKCLLKNASKEILTELTHKNLSTLEASMDYNIRNSIKLFRISSDVIPFGSHPVNKQEWWLDYNESFNNIGSKIKGSNIRVSLHPGQYTVLNTPSKEVFQKSLQDLIYHNRFLEALDVDEKNKIIIHIGGIYNDKKASIKRFISNSKSIPKSVRDRIVIENDERCFNIEDLLYISSKTSFPVVFDALHHFLNPPHKKTSDSDWIKKCKETWRNKDGTQKIHYSQQAKNAKPGSHSKTIFIGEFLNYIKSIDADNLDIMLEVKDKNISCLKAKYCTDSFMPQKFLEQEWAKYKYLILSYSQNAYSQIRNMLKEKNAMKYRVEFYKIIESAIQKERTKGGELNAIEHVWGYFREISEASERIKYQKLVESFSNDKLKSRSIISFLKKLSLKYDISYLLNSYYFIDNLYQSI